MKEDFGHIAKGDFHRLSRGMASDLKEAMSNDLTGRLSENMQLADREVSKKEILRSRIMQNAAQSFSMGR